MTDNYNAGANKPTILDEIHARLCLTARAVTTGKLATGLNRGGVEVVSGLNVVVACRQLQEGGHVRKRLGLCPLANSIMKHATSATFIPRQPQSIVLTQDGLAKAIQEVKGENS